MPGFKGIKDVVDSELEGRTRSYQWRKTPSAATTAGRWYDLSTASGNPKAKNWFDAAPLVAAQVRQSTDGGIFHGANVAPAQKHLVRSSSWCVSSAIALPMQMLLCDYLLYYPTIDDSETGQQDMTNSVSLPRYESGEGVQMLAVTLAARVGGQTFTVNYTNSQGVSGRVSKLSIQNPDTIVGSITTSNATTSPTNFSSQPFIGLQDGDTGVRSIESVQMNGADTGLFAIVLVKVIAETMIAGIDAPVETHYLIHKNEMPRVYDDAFLGWLVLPQNSLATSKVSGNLKFVWN